MIQLGKFVVGGWVDGVADTNIHISSSLGLDQKVIISIFFRGYLTKQNLLN